MAIFMNMETIGTLHNSLVAITTRKHDLFDWKIKPKTSYFDIWSIWTRPT